MSHKRGGYSCQILVLSAFFIMRGKGSLSCSVESMRCDFPFSKGGEVYHSCQPDNVTLGGDGPVYYCHSQVQDSYVYGACSPDCFGDDGSPTEYEAGDPMATLFPCKTEASPCQFPFLWEGVEYTSCTTEGTTFPWCALEVDPLSREMLGSRWGKCDMSSCTSGEEQAREAVAQFAERAVTGSLTLSQQALISPLSVEGELLGLEPGHYVIQLVNTRCGEEKRQGEEVNDLIESSDNETVTKVMLEKWGVSLFPDSGDIDVSNGSVRITESCSSPGISETIEECQELACANIYIGEVSSGLDTTLLIIIIVIAILVVSILFCLIIYCLCCRRKAPQKFDSQSPSLESLGDEFGGSLRSKSPLFDELSIPFIDASLPPTPKTSRTGNGLEILLGRRLGSHSSVSVSESEE